MTALRGLPRKQDQDTSTSEMPPRTVCRDLLDCGIDQLRAVEIGHDLDVVGLQPRIEVVDPGVHSLEHARRIFAAQQQHGTLDDVIHVVLADNAVTFLVGELQLAKIAHEDRRAIVLGDDDVAEVAEGLDQADAADDVTELTAVEYAAAGAGAVGRDRVGNVLQRQVEADQLLRVELELELGGHATETGDVGDPRHLLDRGDHGPLLDLGQFAQVLGIGLQGVVEDLPGRRRQRIEAGRKPRRQGHVRRSAP